MLAEVQFVPAGQRRIQYNLKHRLALVLGAWLISAECYRSVDNRHTMIVNLVIERSEKKRRIWIVRSLGNVPPESCHATISIYVTLKECLKKDTKL